MTSPERCKMCGSCCKTPPFIRDYEVYDVESALNRIGIDQQAFDGRKLIKRDDYCIVLDQSTMKCRLHEVFKPSACLAKSCYDIAEEIQTFELAKRSVIRQKEIAIQRHGRVAEGCFDSILG